MLINNLNFRIFVFIFLLYHSTLFFSLGLYSVTTPPYVEPIVSSIFCFVIFLILKPYKINKFFLVSIIISFTSLLIGFYNKWYLYDILGDTFRFIAPFFAYAVGLQLLSKLNFIQLEYLVKLIILILSIIALFSILKILSILINDQLLFSYSQRANLNIPILLFLYIYLLFICRPLSKVRLFNFFLFAPFFFIYMISDLSKTNFILMFIFLTVPLFIFKKHILNIFLILLISILISLTFKFVSERFVPMFNTISESIYEKETSEIDSSTSSRLVESSSAIKELSNSPFSFLIGYGSGALLFNVPNDTSGISKYNFRDNGGLHHIHIEYVSILYRNGIIGLFFYLFWTIYIIKRSFKPILRYENKMIRLSVFNIAIGIYFLSLIFVSFTNAAMYGKIVNGLLGSMVIVLSNLINKYEK